MLLCLEASLSDLSKVTGSPSQGQRKVKVTNFEVSISARGFFVCKNFAFLFQPFGWTTAEEKIFQDGRRKNENRATISIF